MGWGGAVVVVGGGRTRQRGVPCGSVLLVQPGSRRLPEVAARNDLQPRRRGWAMTLMTAPQLSLKLTDARDSQTPQVRQEQHGPWSSTVFQSSFQISGWFQSRSYHVSRGFRMRQGRRLMTVMSGADLRCAEVVRPVDRGVIDVQEATRPPNVRLEFSAPVLGSLTSRLPCKSISHDSQ
jgi:hypothetical protein